MVLGEGITMIDMTIIDDTMPTDEGCSEAFDKWAKGLDWDSTVTVFKTEYHTGDLFDIINPRDDKSIYNP
jgi:hypothetical protein